MKTNLPNTTLLNLIDHLISRLLAPQFTKKYSSHPAPALPSPPPPRFSPPKSIDHPSTWCPTTTTTPPAPAHPVTASDRLLQSMLTQPFLPGFYRVIGIRKLACGAKAYSHIKPSIRQLFTWCSTIFCFFAKRLKVEICRAANSRTKTYRVQSEAISCAQLQLNELPR